MRHTDYWKAWKAHVSMKACTGFRTAEMALPDKVLQWDMDRASRANITWLIDGAYVLCPTKEQLEGLTSNDYMLIRPPLAKADPFGHMWSSKATCIRFESGDDLNAAWHVQQMELDNT